jgi:hypothetical protein
MVAAEAVSRSMLRPKARTLRQLQAAEDLVDDLKSTKRSMASGSIPLSMSGFSSVVRELKDARNARAEFLKASRVIYLEHHEAKLEARRAKHAYTNAVAENPVAIYPSPGGSKQRWSARNRKGVGSCS